MRARTRVLFCENCGSPVYIPNPPNRRAFGAYQAILGLFPGYSQVMLGYFELFGVTPEEAASTADQGESNL